MALISPCSRCSTTPRSATSCWPPETKLSVEVPAKSGRGSAMRILDMMTFVALARHRHFGRAAQELHTTQPAISIRLAAMEQEFGCKLLHRTGRDFGLTPAGERVLQTFRTILSTYDGL